MISPIGNGSGSREAQPVKKPTEFATDFIAVTTNDASNLAAQYIEHGWRLVPIPNGSKGPKTMGWNRKENTIADSTGIPPGWGVGLAHTYSKTMALDIDNWQHAAALLAQRGVDLRTLYDAPDAVTIESGREGRGKLIYAMPFGLTLPTKRINYAAADDDTKVAYELRCATADGLTAQDVLPSTAIHPITLKPYRWGGNGHWSRLPTLPMELLAIWQELTTRDTSRAVQTNQPACSATKPVVTLEIAHEMLTFISADCGYDDWRNVGMGLAHQFGSAAFDLWNDWSKTSPKYNEREMRSQWASFKTDHPNGVTIGTVMHLARHGGWAGIPPDISDLFPAISAQAGTHPLAVFKEISFLPRHPEFLIPGTVGMGLVVISGEPGVGKTSTLLPLAAMVAGIHQGEHPLAPRHWRHVIYIVEDVEQAQRILAGMATQPWFGVDAARERLHIVDAVRMAPAEVAKVGRTYAVQFTRIVDGVVLLPLVVIDTKSAVLDIEDENSNSETSQAIAILKQGFEKLPTWLIGHTAKASQGVTDAASLSSRGAGSAGGDGNQTLFLVKDKGTLYIKRGKTRFEATWDELQIGSHTTTMLAPDQWGDLAPLTLRWNSITPRTASPTSSKALRDQQAADADRENLHAQIIELVDSAFANQMPLNRAAIKSAIGGNSVTLGNAIEFLLTNGHLYEVDIPKDVRKHPKKASYMVALTEVERLEFVKSGTVPSSKTEIAPSWTLLP